MTEMNDTNKELIIDAVKRLAGFKRRQYQSSIALKYFSDHARIT